jgi:shikimate 5-dehydrogenase
MSFPEAIRTNPDIIINATPAGMKPNINSSVIPKEFLRKQMVVFDIVYNPLETKLLKDAKKVGCRTISGVEMLLEQAFASFEIFTGMKASQEKIRKDVYRELHK